MCNSIAEGGQRCAAHTRPALQSATFGTHEWDEAAAEYASTPTGARDLHGQLTAAKAAGDLDRAAAIQNALTSGETIRARNQAAANAIAAENPATKTITIRLDSWDPDSTEEVHLTPRDGGTALSVNIRGQHIGVVDRYEGSISRSVAGTRFSDSGRPRLLWKARGIKADDRFMYDFNSRADAIRHLYEAVRYEPR